MSISFKDRVKDTSVTTGTGNFTLSGSAPSGFVDFNTAFGTGSTAQFAYCIDDGAGNWEVGIGHLSVSTTLVRDTILASSNSGSAVSFAAGSKTVFCDLPAAHLRLAARLTADATYNNTSTFANVTDLSVNVVAAGVYEVRANLMLTYNGEALKVDFNGGSATVTAFEGKWTHARAGFPNSDNVAYAFAASTSTTVGANTTDTSFATFVGTLVVNAAGTFILRAAQAAAQVSNSTISAGSHMTLTKLN